MGKPISYLSDVALRDPVLVAAFRGWNDAGDGASQAAMHLAKVWRAEKVAVVDPEDFYDFQAVRPHVRLVDGETRTIVWPANELWAARTSSSPHDILILIGTEPNVRWRTFSSVIVDAALRHCVKLVVTLGALLADVPHSRSVPVTATADDSGLVERLRLQPTRYEGPTGIVGVLHDAFAKAQVPSASLWAAVPHYLGANANPKAALALARKTVELVEHDADLTELEIATRAYEKRVAEIVADDEDVQAYVQALEERADMEAANEIDPSGVPSGDQLAAELERFLRERGEGPAA